MLSQTRETRKVTISDAVSLPLLVLVFTSFVSGARLYRACAFALRGECVDHFETGPPSYSEA